MKTVEDYLKLPYHVRIVADSTPSGVPGLFASVEELPGCITQSATREGIWEMLDDAMRGWFTAAIARGMEIPEPVDDDVIGFSGNVSLRMPKGLHQRLAEEAERQGSSLNQLLVALVSGAVGWDDVRGSRFAAANQASERVLGNINRPKSVGT